MISEVLSEIPLQLLRNSGEDAIAPGFAELNELAKIDGISKRVVVVKEDNDILACAVCNIEERQHHGIHLKVYALFGYLVHDYCRIFCKSPEAMETLKETVRKDARQQGCDIIIWRNIPSELVPEGTLPIHTEIKIFSASQNEHGWSRFYRSKHVKYSLNRAKKVNGDYRVELIDGLVPEPLMKEFAKMHINRWGFAGFVSAFQTNSKRIAEYCTHPENKHFLRIMSGDEVIACHYGMRYGDTLLFHTPIINPKYLDLSPMKLILAETARYCENNGLNSIDFGHGDEAYKDGYCTLPRYTCQFLQTLTIKGKVAEQIGAIYESIFFEKIKHLKKIISSKTKRQKSQLLSRISLRDFSSNLSGEQDYFTFSNWGEFYDFNAKLGNPVFKWQFERFRQNKTVVFIAITKQNKIDASAWLRASKETSQSEDSAHCSMILFDIHYSSNLGLDSIFKYVAHLTGNSFNVAVSKNISKYIKSNDEYIIG